MKVLILTSSKSVLKWKTLPAKLNAITGALNSGKNANFDTVEVQYTDQVPEVKNNRITHAWFKKFQAPYFKQGYDIIGLHMIDKHRRRWGIKPTLRGSNPIMSGEEGQFYFWSDERTLRNGFSQFIETLLHEIRHEYHQHTKTKDTTHTDHDRDITIVPSMSKLDWGLYQPRRMLLKTLKNVLESLVGLLTLQVSNTSPTEPKLPVLDGLQPLVDRQAQKVLDEMKSYGHEMRITQGFRSHEEQNKLYAQGRTTKGNIVTNARGGESLHQYGVAADFVFRKLGFDAPDTLWEVFGLVGKKHGFEWGGDWKGFTDRPHLQMTLDYSLRDFQSGKVDYNKYK